MREKTEKLVLTFQSTTAAMAMEKACMQKKTPGRLIPVPREISAGCGMAWCAPREAKEAVLQTAEEAHIEIQGCYEMLL